MSDDLSVFEITIVSQDGVMEPSRPVHTQNLIVRASTFFEAIHKIEADNFAKAKLPEEYYVSDVHAEWRPDLEDIIE